MNIDHALRGGFESQRTRRVVFAFVLLCTLSLFLMPLLKYAALRTGVYDLGQFTTFHINVFQGDGPAYALRTHANLFILPYAVFVALFPSAITLLLLQSTAIVAGGWLTALYWRRRIGDGAHWILLLYFLSVPVWYNDLFDFHFDHLLFLFFPMFFLVAERPVRPTRNLALFGIALCICAVKEVYALTVVPLGLLVAIRYRQRWLGALISISALLYFFAVTMWLIPHFTGGKPSGAIWKEAFGHLGASPPEMFFHVIGHPWETLVMILGEPRKWIYVLGLLGPLVFLPLCAPLEAAAALPALLIALFSRNPNHYAIVHQYTAGVTAPFFVAFVAALAAPRFAGRRSLLIAGALVASLLLLVIAGPSPLSVSFWKEGRWNYEKTAYRPTDRDRRIREAVERFIPKDPSVPVSVQNTVNLSRLTARRYAFPFPEGILEPADVPRWKPGPPHGAGDDGVFAEYLVLDEKRPWFVYDKGCDWKEGKCRPGPVTSRYRSVVGEARRNYRTVFADDGFEILKRRRPEEPQQSG